MADAAQALGIGERTVYRWIQLGRRRNGYPPIYARFVDGLQAAQLEREDHLREMIALAIAKAQR